MQVHWLDWSYFVNLTECCVPECRSICNWLQTVISASSMNHDVDERGTKYREQRANQQQHLQQDADGMAAADRVAKLPQVLCELFRVALHTRQLLDRALHCRHERWLHFKTNACCPGEGGQRKFTDSMMSMPA